MKASSGLLTLLGVTLLGCTLTALATTETPVTAAETPLMATEARATAAEAPAPPLQQAQGTIYYVRPDGGSANQCTGQADAPYPGSGTGQACAWDHPFRALPPGGFPLIAGGDTLIIASGSYVMGLGAPGADSPDVCYAEGAYDCLMPPVPSGPDAVHPTRILGAGWDAGCPNPPELWGNERPWFIVNLTDSSNVELACLEITDHSGCIEDHTGGLACQRDTPPFGAWASVGLYAEDSANVHLRDLNIHGLAATGVHAGRLTDWTVENVRVAGNGAAGWDGDLWDEYGDSNSGTLTFRHWTVEWNGCGETYPGEQPTGCWAQTAGGYGDGVGTGATGGNWIIEDSAFLYNTSDGLDLLYHSLGGSVAINRVRAEGNAGNQIKVAGQMAITNSVLVGNCAFFEGKPFTYNVDPCRALGNTLEVAYTGGEHVSIVNSTLSGEGDGLIGAGPREDYACNDTETVVARNNIFLGGDEFLSSDDISFLFYQEGCANLRLDSDYNIADHVKDITCGADDPYVRSGSHDRCDVSPGLVNPALGAFDAHLLPDSPAIDAGTAEGAPPDDFDGHMRDATPDIGAYEGGDSMAYLPEVTRTYAQSSPTIAGCAVFPADNIWNAVVDTLPVDANSTAYVNTIGPDAHVHADFGSGLWNGGPIGIPYTTVPGSQPGVSVSFYYPDESDPGPYLIPPAAPIEGGPGSDGDRHVLVIDRDACILYELYDAHPQPGGSWTAGSGAIFDLDSNALRPAGWTSADAAGLPILPGLVRYDEVAAGEIRHAIRFTAPQTRRATVWPARHYASSLTGTQYPPMGQRFRLKANYDTSGFSPQVQVILRALKTYGMILADNGSAWYISGAPDERWDNDALHELHSVPGSAFEAVDVSSLMVSPDSGQVRGNP